MTDPAQRLLRRLDLERGDDTEDAVIWHGRAGEGALNINDAIYGGMVLAQTIVAAGRTVPDRSVHSLSQMFLRAGRADVPLTYRCSTLYGGRRYSMLEVRVLQEGDVIRSVGGTAVTAFDDLTLYLGRSGPGPECGHCDYRTVYVRCQLNRYGLQRDQAE